MDELLSSSAATRSGLDDAIEQVRDCSAIDSGVSALAEITQNRRSQLDKARSLNVDSIDGGGELRKALVQALSASLSADESFLAWARQVESEGCSTGAATGPDYRDGVDHSISARQHKIKFVRLWNPIASEYGLASHTEADI